MATEKTKKAAPAKAKAVKKETVAKAEKEQPAKEVKAKAVKKGDEEKKPVAPVRTEAWAVARPIGVTPRKVALVCSLVRGKTLDQAYDILSNTNKAAVTPVFKAIRSAEANAVNNFHMDRALLYVDQIWANESFRLKRFEPRAKGSSSPIWKRWSQIKVVLKQKGATK